MDLEEREFEWDLAKEAQNVINHGVDFSTAQIAFADPKRLLAKDIAHSGAEERYHCLGRVEGGVLTVRFTIRPGRVRIIGAGFWRKGRKAYEKENQIHG